MSAHTPGPWIWGKDHRGLYGAGPDSDVLSYARYENCWLAFGEKQEANARLIAEAPELLDALRELVDTLPPEVTAPMWQRARAAIAKATGQS